MGCANSGNRPNIAEAQSNLSLKENIGRRISSSSRETIQSCRSPKFDKLLMTNRERAAMIGAGETISAATRLLLLPPFSAFSTFAEHVHMTGLGGVTSDNLSRHDIVCAINVAKEAPAIPDYDGLRCYKYPICENLSFPIGDWLPQIVDQIHAANGNVVVYCISGMSRSATVILAYAVKYLGMKLLDAFAHLQEIRPYARPNRSFFKQLIKFEHDCLGTNSIKSVRESFDMEKPKTGPKSSEHQQQHQCQLSPKSTKEIKPPKGGGGAGAGKQRTSTKIGKRKQHFVILPDIYRFKYPHLYKLEIELAKKAIAQQKITNGKGGGAGSDSSNVQRRTKINKSVAALAATNSRKNSNLGSAAAALAAASSLVKRSSSGKQISSVKRKKKATQTEITVATSCCCWPASNELKPFVVDDVSYQSFIVEFEKARHTNNLIPDNNEDADADAAHDSGGASGTTFS